MKMHTFPLLKFIADSFKIKSQKIMSTQSWAKKLFGSNKLASLGEKNISVHIPIQVLAYLIPHKIIFQKIFSPLCKTLNIQSKKERVYFQGLTFFRNSFRHVIVAKCLTFVLISVTCGLN